jgi:hypothetical protein
MRDGDWNLLINPAGSGAKLYHIAKDQNETTSLAAKEPEITKRMSEAALKRRKPSSLSHKVNKRRKLLRKRRVQRGHR